MVRFFKRLVALLKDIGRKKEDISWKEISGITKADRLKK